MLRRRKGFIERTLASLVSVGEYSAAADLLAERSGLLQRVDPRVKLAGLLGMLVAAAASHRLETIMALFLVAVALLLASGIPLSRIAMWVWVPVLLFSGVIAAPAMFVTPGPALHLGEASLPLTTTGVRSAAYLLSRSLTAATLCGLLVLTTPWPHLLKALRVFRVPVIVVVVLGMTHRYVFSILQTALNMFESRKSRTVGVLDGGDRRRIASASAGVLLSRSLQLSSEIHQAMLARGFRGEVHILNDFRLTPADWRWCGVFATLVAVAAWMGR